MPVSINRYNKFPEYFGDNSIDLDDDAPYHMLMNSSHVFTATHTIRTDVSANQLATGNGYTQATGGLTGKALGTPTWVESSGTITFDATDTTWTASGGAIGPADDCVLFDDTSTAPVDALMYSIEFAQSETAGDGTNFVLTWNASGIFTVA
jgi:hypothetical protein